jgi:hypothetical protein
VLRIVSTEKSEGFGRFFYSWLYSMFQFTQIIRPIFSSKIHTLVGNTWRFQWLPSYAR